MPMFLRQEDHKFKTLLGYIARACFMKERKRKGESERRKGWKKEGKEKNQRARTVV